MQIYSSLARFCVVGFPLNMRDCNIMYMVSDSLTRANSSCSESFHCFSANGRFRLGFEIAVTAVVVAQILLSTLCQSIKYIQIDRYCLFKIISYFL